MKISSLFVLILLAPLICSEPSAESAEVKIVKQINDVKPAFPHNNISVVFASDNNYAMYLGVCLQSLIDNSDKRYCYDIWILDGGISDSRRKVILSLPKEKKNFSIRFFDISYFMEKIKDKLHLCHEHLSIAAYYRLFIPQIFLSYKRILYLDSDMIINRDISHLLNIDLGGKTIGAVKDHGLTTCLVECAKRVKKDRWREYFGSGVMLFDIEKARKENLTDKSCRYLFTQENYKNLYKGLFFEDQDALNAVCIDNVKLLDEKWNSVVRIVILFPLKIDCVIHYAGPDKPWNSTIYLADLWWEYAEKTPFYSDIIIENMRTIVFHKIFVWSSYFCAILIDWLHLGRFVQNFPIILTYLNFVVKKEKMAAYKHLTKFIRSQSQFYFNSCFSFVRKKSNFKSYDHQTTDL